MANPAPKEQIEYFNQHPPSCLASFVVQPAFLTEVVFDGHGASGQYPDGLVECPNSIFKVRCRCGGDAHRLVAQATLDEISYYKDLLIAGRYLLQCTACGAENLLFDKLLHGYNPEIDLLEGRNIKDDLKEYYGGELTDHSDEQVNCQCTCQATRFEIFTRFEHNPFNFGDPEFAGREQDFFSWFTVIAKCTGCAKLNVPIDIECA
jgi:hypothetical protein